MAAKLPYLPPLERFRNDVASIATGTVDDVRAAQSAAAKTALAMRGALASVPAVIRGANDVFATPFRAAGDRLMDFGQNLFGGSQVAAPTLGLPQLAQPGAPAAVATAAPVAQAPATQAPVAMAAPGGLVTTRSGNNVMIRGDGAAPVPVAMQDLPMMVRQSPVSRGISEQANYAEMQRQAIMNAAQAAAASGHPDNASYRYAAALHALPTLSGSNNFASVESQAAAEAASVAERERANIRTTGEVRYSTNERSKEVRRNAQPTVIGEEINPDPTTRIFAPTIKRYGFVERDEKTGKIVVRDMQGTEQKPPAPPISRSEFITKNKKANPEMSESDLGREYDKKYGGKG